jgi:hypothetical protein
MIFLNKIYNKTFTRSQTPAWECIALVCKLWNEREHLNCGGLTPLYITLLLRNLEE